MEDQYLGIRVLEQVEQFVIEVAVVDIDGHAARLHGRELRFEVLGAVVEVEAHLGAFAQARPGKGSRQARGAILVFAPTQAGRPADHRFAIRNFIGNRFPDRRVIQFHVFSSLADPIPGPGGPLS